MSIKGKSWLFTTAVLFIILLGVAAIAAPLISPHNPTEQNIDRRFSAPDAVNFLGTDNFGRDLLSRIIYGSRSALLVGIISASMAVTIGMIVGL